MLSKTFSTAAVVLAASSLVSAQTSTTCQPLEKSCPADAALGNKKISCDFTKGACDDFMLLPGTTLDYNGKGAVFSIKTEKQAPTIESHKYIFFGRVDVEVQAAAGAGIVTSAVLQSDDLDEIDLEWVGGDNAQVQSNYFSQGRTETYDRGAYHPVSNPTGSIHTYSVEWTSQAVKWLIDGNVVRTLTAAEAKGANSLPQTPMKIKLGTWVAGRSDAPEGTVKWAGGKADFSKAPFLGYYKSITVTDYAGGDKPASKSIKEYTYGDKTGTWESIKVVEGEGSDSPSSSSSKSATKTSSHASSSKAATTMSTAASTSEPTSTGDATTTGAEATSSETSKPSTVPGSSATRGVATIGGAMLAGAGVLLAQWIL